ncbi:hypothetical protein KI811_16140 [Geobacter hydrogenophilus]|uniref:Uncharacterized protein n=1 Tax=Geobacter hydrogenophilus TaxID=40983 RepID=A0A9W6G362_9BACT|nr:hypothetical protein [Geobacter hydrogenophilus]MBT0895338.1 hypothetical protein [Geobacter hydrogenophilus]GLI39565.1 hypothetical protein GHYDROH2_30660 [Geobacter hydrogenophilus]
MNTQIIKHVTIKGCQVPVYAPRKEFQVSIDVTRIITGVIFGSLLTAVGAIPFLI